ncbi:phosphoglycerate mutase family protein [Trichuris suis]|nr:phosphoglycerate mutase family protein [Trichuris suis]
MTIIWCLRHAERQDYVDASWARTAVSPDDSPLAAKGHVQAFEAARRLQNEKIHYIFSSPFLRCVQTANYVADATGLTIKIEHGLSEVLNVFPPGHKRIDELKKEFPNVDRSYTSFVIPDAAEHNDFDCFGRVGMAVSKIVENYTSDPDSVSILLVGHGASIAGVIKHLTGQARYVGLYFCFNGGTCYTPKGKNQPFCQCPSGYWGSRCQHRAGNKPCSGHVCQNNGICDSDGFTRHGGRRYPYACRCVGKFSGPFCAQSREKVMCMYQKKCGNRATLVVERGQCKCKCKPEYTGRDCEKALPCASVRCEHGTKCDNRNARCNCDGTFYTGKLCDRISVQKLKQHNAENYCSTSRFDCQHGAHCIVANVSKYYVGG